MLRNNAEVLEVGSHLSSFLQTAEEWGWRPTGLDIGESTTAFARGQGVSVKRLSLEDYSPTLKKPEALFIWNCFEQLEDPSRTLQQSYRLLDRHGLLLVRVPNAAFYRDQHRRLRAHHFDAVATHDSSLIEPPYPQMSAQLSGEWLATRRESQRPRPTGGPWIEILCRARLS